MKKKSLVGWAEKEDYKKLLSYVRDWGYWNLSKKRIDQSDIKVCITIEELK